MYVVYKIVNIINENYYIGVHKTDNVNDTYYGSGLRIIRAIKKYGIHNFKKSIIFITDDQINAYNKEKELVNENTLKDSKCYNIRIGGEIIDSNICRRGFQTCKDKKIGLFDISRKKEYVKRVMISRANNPHIQDKNPFFNSKWQEKNNIFKNKELNIDKIKKISEKIRNKMIGINNPRFGFVWIKNLDLNQSKCVNQNELENYFSLGWIKGRLK